ncbi:YHS domain-containing protein [Bythopirellula goksoeyrii]|uniref:YHS domain protein n=1 Tax=Bythopirellula goksoeyrii TaxID=1400387 RepID=A0A5B9QE72_9BACT|nr:YHS domain-containing protein [Bythopirellula goksoeyrii]QEG35792.1 YHS domain protein [Bythopirellula goksoeyrii]
MPDLTTFAKHVQDVLSDAFREPHWTPEELERYMAEVELRRVAFENLADQLNQTVVRPRLEILAKQFPNTALLEEQQSHQSSCTFEYCDRFPAFATIEFSIEHDMRFETLFVHLRCRIVPVFVKFVEQDNLPLPSDSVEEEEVADWVEERLLEFLDTYMQLDAESDSEEELTTDPVCGMKILHSAAAGTESYYGHPYYFCSKGCLTKFQDDPEQYAQIKTI